MSHQPPRKFHIGQRVMVVNCNEHMPPESLYQQGTVVADEKPTQCYGGMITGYLVELPNLEAKPIVRALFGNNLAYCIPGFCLIPIDDPDQEKVTDEIVELVNEV